MNDDDFADVREMVNGLGAGILAGEGESFHNRVKGHISKDGTGFSYQIRCDKCGQTLIVTASWAELAIMGQGRLPPNGEWRHNGAHGVFVPAQGCPRDADQIRLGITPDECNRNLTSGIAAQKIRREDVQAFLANLGRG